MLEKYINSKQSTNSYMFSKTCFLKKHILAAKLLYYGLREYIINNLCMFGPIIRFGLILEISTFYELFSLTKDLS